MKIKTSELTGAALDWAVAKAEGLCVEHAGGAWFYIPMADQDRIGAGYSPSTQWYLAGPIIEREKIAIDFDGSMWCASDNEKPVAHFAETPLIAAMRCYVASKLGDEVEVPDELVA